MNQYKAIDTQILGYVEARLAELGKTLLTGFLPPGASFLNNETKHVKVKVRRDSEKNPKFDPLVDHPPIIIVSMNSYKRIEEATAIKVFADHEVLVEFMQVEEPRERGEDEKLRLILERIRRTLHIVRIGNVVDITGKKVMNDCFVKDQDPYTLPFKDKKINVSGQIFTYQTMETRNNEPGL